MDLGPFRLLTAIVVGGLTFFASMTVFGVAGVTATFVAVPVPLFLGFIAIWPVVKPLMPRETFTQWLAYQLTVMVVLGVLIAAVEAYRSATQGWS